MRFFSHHKNLFFDNNALLFSKQDTPERFLLAFFIFALPFFSLLSHPRLFLSPCVLFLLYIAVRSGAKIFTEKRETRLYILFLATVFSGVFKAGAAKDSLLFFALALSGFLPTLYPCTRRAFSRALAFSGGVCGALAAFEYLSGRALALWSDGERFGALARAGAPFGNPNILGAFLSVCLIFAFDEMRRALKRGGWSLYALCFSLSLGGLLLTFSRGAWFGAAFGFLFYLFRLLPRKSKEKERALCFLPLFSPLLSRAFSVFSPDSSVSYRFSLWKSVLSLPLPSLLFGVGEGKGALLSLLSPYMAAGLEKIEHTHSLFLRILTAEGLLGLSLFLLFLFFRLKKKRECAACDGALLSLLLYGIFDDPFYSGQLGVIFWFLANVN